MYKNFKEYYEGRSNAEFDNRVNNLLAEVAASEISFEKFWEEVGLPAVLAEKTSEDQDLLTLMEAGWGGMMGGMRNALGGMARGAANMMGFGGQPQAQQPQQPNNSLGADQQAKVQASVDFLKRELTRAMHGVVEKMKQNRDSIGYQVAQHFMQRMNKVADGLKFQRGEGKFDKTGAFGNAANQNVQHTGDRMKAAMQNPQQRHALVSLHAKRLGVEPSILNTLIDNGFTNPAQWQGIIQARSQGAQAPKTIGAPQTPPQMAQDQNPDLQARLAAMAQRR